MVTTKQKITNIMIATGIKMAGFGSKIKKQCKSSIIEKGHL